MFPKDMHVGTAEVRNTEAILGWTRNTFFSGLTSALFWFIETHYIFGKWQYSAACVVGAFLSSIWLGSAFRIKQLMTHWNGKLSDLETLDANLVGGRVFAGKDFEKLDHQRTTHHFLLLCLIGAIIVGWLTLGGTSMIWGISNAQHQQENYPYE
jgi:hypothetical protein